MPIPPERGKVRSENLPLSVAALPAKPLLPFSSGLGALPKWTPCGLVFRLEKAPRRVGAGSNPAGGVC